MPGQIINNFIIANSITSIAGDSLTLPNRSGIYPIRVKIRSMPVGWYEVDGYKESFREDDSSAVRIFQGPWTTRHYFKQWALGTAWNDGGTLKRTIPAQHPEMPWLYAVECELVAGMGAYTNNPFVRDEVGQIIPMIAYYDSGTGSDALSCRYALTYRALPYEVRSDDEMAANSELMELHRNVERMETYALQTIPIPGQQLVFAEGPSAVKNTPIADSAKLLLLPTKEITYIWHAVPDVPESEISLAQGKVNDEAFDAPILLADGTTVGALPDTGYPRETLLFTTIEKRRIRTTEGRVAWNLIYKFLYRPQGWNHFPARNGQFYLATFDGTMTGRAMYEEVDFDTLFTQPTTARYYQGSGHAGLGVNPG